MSLLVRSGKMTDMDMGTEVGRKIGQRSLLRSCRRVLGRVFRWKVAWRRRGMRIRLNDIRYVYLIYCLE